MKKETDEELNEEKVVEPKASLEAIAAPGPLTIAQVAILERIESPVLAGDVSDIGKCLDALWLLSIPLREAAKWMPDDRIGGVRAKALEWSAKMDTKEYVDRLEVLLKSCTAFWKMLPRPENGSKKKGRATGGSLKSRSGRAAPTDGR